MEEQLYCLIVQINALDTDSESVDLNSVSMEERQQCAKLIGYL